MEPKHTPGPWHLIETTNLRNPDVSAYLLANKTPYVHGILDSCNPQDAALIAAAPELLDALLETLSCIDQHTDDPVIGPIIEGAMRAIAKARGESWD